MYTHVIPCAWILEKGMPRPVSDASLQIGPQGIDAAELKQIWLLDLRSAEFLQLLQPAAQHRLDALIYLKARTSRVRLSARLNVGNIREMRYGRVIQDRLLL